jgi:hypothetical protein
MEILDSVIEQLKNIEGHPKLKEVIFPIRRQAEAEKARQLKQGTRIEVAPQGYQCPYCTTHHTNPEKFYLHLVQKHITPPEEAREEIGKQEVTYEEDMAKLEALVHKYTEVMLDVKYPDEAGDA